MLEPRAELPLAGVRILDLSRILAGPFATQQLADLGADVIKLEPPVVGDGTRAWGPPFDPSGQSAYFLCTNRGKRSIAVDLARTEGVEVVRRLAARADALIHNFLPEQWRRLLGSIQPELAANERLIIAAIRGFGARDPRGAQPGYDALVQASSGLMSITGPAQGEWCKTGVAIVDLAAGLFVACAVLAALKGRGDGAASRRSIVISLEDCALSMLANVASNVLVSGRDAGRFGNAHPSIVPYQTFEASDGSVFIGVGTDAQWRELCAALGLEEWAAREEWRTNPGRVRDRERLCHELACEIGRRPAAGLAESLATAGVPCAPLRSVKQALDDPAFRARGGVVLHADGSRTVASPYRDEADLPLPAATPAPRLGEQSRAILDELGYAQAEIRDLLARGVVAQG